MEAKRLSFLISAVFACLALGTTAIEANPIMPSFIETVTGSSWDRVLYFRAEWKLAFLMLIGISLVETFIIRRYYQSKPLKNLCLMVLTINAITSIAGCYIIPARINIWYAMCLAFITAVISECFLLSVFSRTPLRQTLRPLYASLQMNAATYAILAAILAYLIYLPVLGTEDRELLHQLKGKIVVAENDNKTGRVIDLRTGKLSEKHHVNVHLTDTGGGIISSIEGESFAFSPDRKTICCMRNGRYVLLDISTKQIIYDLKQKDYPWVDFSSDSRYCTVTNFVGGFLVDIKAGKAHAISFNFGSTPIFSRNCRKLAYFTGKSAICVVDCKTGKRVEFHAPGGYTPSMGSHNLTWSPDGNYLAYDAYHPSKYAADYWQPDIRVITADGKRTVTVCRKYPVDSLFLEWQ